MEIMTTTIITQIITITVVLEDYQVACTTATTGDFTTQFEVGGPGRTGMLFV